MARTPESAWMPTIEDAIADSRRSAACVCIEAMPRHLALELCGVLRAMADRETQVGPSWQYQGAGWRIHVQVSPV